MDHIEERNNRLQAVGEKVWEAGFGQEFKELLTSKMDYDEALAELRRRHPELKI